LLPNEVVSIQVFNRWGGLVYESENYQNDWDGKGNVGASSGEHLAVGTFFYIIRLNVAQVEKNGYITLWR
jgi:gliding motility-associated-like protein